MVVYMVDNLTISCKPNATLNMEIYFIKLMKKSTANIWTDIVTKHATISGLKTVWYDRDIQNRSYYDFSDKSEKSLIIKISKENVFYSDKGLYACNVSGLIDSDVSTFDEVKEIQILCKCSVLCKSSIATICISCFVISFSKIEILPSFNFLLNLKRR